MLTTSDSDDLGKALQENLKLRRELATGLAEAKGEKLAALRYRLARIVGVIRSAFSGLSRRASNVNGCRGVDDVRQCP
jgi:hypothetical protein